MMLRIAIIGFGFMGRAHYTAIQKLPDAKVVAIATRNLKAVTEPSAAWSNLEGIGQARLNVEELKLFTDYHQMVAMRELDVVDICAPTHLHLDMVTAALTMGKHVFCEKPVGRTFSEVEQIAKMVGRARSYFMPAMCMRFWPGWTWLRGVVAEKRYGKVLSASFRRVSPRPPPTRWSMNGEQSGGALLDLHIHDVDFIYWLFGMPHAVFSRGYPLVSGEIDHVMTQYIFDEAPLVTAEGGWTFDEGMKFSMRYMVKFERATADFDLNRQTPLMLAQGGKLEAVPCEGPNAYQAQLAYFLDCIRQQQKPSVVTVEDAVAVTKIIEAEHASIKREEIVSLS